jgi:hypothetical protein
LGRPRMATMGWRIRGSAILVGVEEARGNGAGNGIRTRDLQLGKLTLYR